jgi:hypothetical protein
MESPNGMMLMAALTGETMATIRKKESALPENERRLFFMEQSPFQDLRQQFMASNNLRNKFVLPTRDKSI